MKQRPRYFIYFHLLLLAGVCLRRAVDIRSKNKSKKHKRGGGSDDEEKRGLYIETAEDEGIRKEGEKACSTRVSLIAFISKRGVRPLWYHHGLYSSQKQRQHREHTPGPDLFLSSIILFYFLARPPLLGPQLPFDLSPSPPRRRFIFIYEPMPSTPFYVLHFFLFLFHALLFSSSSTHYWNHYRRIGYRDTRDHPFAIESKQLIFSMNLLLVIFRFLIRSSWAWVAFRPEASLMEMETAKLANRYRDKSATSVLNVLFFSWISLYVETYIYSESQTELLWRHEIYSKIPKSMLHRLKIDWKGIKYDALWNTN